MKIQTATLDFIKNLAANNEKPWFDANKKPYEAAKSNMTAFVKELHTAMSKHDHIESAKLMRIYRDVRFSLDKTPYKSNFGVGLTRATSLLRGGYYVHIEPGNSFAGGGFWAPEADDLKRIRTELAADISNIKAIEADATFMKYFGSIKGDGLKTAPKGFDKDLEGIEYIRKKQFVVMRPFSDKEVLGESFLHEVDVTFQTLRPFFDYMSDILTTDSNGVSIIGN